MAGSLNKVMLIGNVGADPEIRRTQDGRPIANFRIATSESWRDKNSGERRENTEWHTIVVFAEGLAKICEQYVRKGSKVYVEGMQKTRKWQDKNGDDRYSTEVVLQAYAGTLTLLDSREGNGSSDRRDRDDDRGSRSSSRSNDRRDDDRGRSTSRGNGGGGGGYRSDMDDDIPFAPEWRI